VRTPLREYYPGIVATDMVYSQTLTIALVLSSAFLHAVWNAILRTEPDKDRALVAAVGIAAVLAAAVAAVRWQLGELPFATTTALVWALGAGLLEWTYFVSLARALERGPLGPVYTVSRGGSIVLVFPLSIALFDERLTLLAGAGAAVVCAGLALSGARTGDHRTTHGSAIVWAVVCAIAIAGYHLAYKAALGAGGNPSAVFAAGLGVATALNLVRVRRVTAVLRTRGPRVVGMGILCGGSFLLLLEALTRGGAGLVMTLRNTSVLFATVLAFAIGDAPRRAQVAGAALVAAGAILMAW
jgi:drug/metabolite transporter (DMT)-like permease